MSVLNYVKPTKGEIEKKSIDFMELMKKRRAVREFSSEIFPEETLKNIINTAASAPSGANRQPWKFVIVKDPSVKTSIRMAAEKEEKENYCRRYPVNMKKELEIFATNWQKPFLEEAPYLVVVFKQLYEKSVEGIRKNYYVDESVGIAIGFLLASIHNAGLVALTYTPQPMRFLNEILSRPENEKASMIIPVGFPKDNTQIPVLSKKNWEEITVIV